MRTEWNRLDAGFSVSSPNNIDGHLEYHLTKFCRDYSEILSIYNRERVSGLDAVGNRFEYPRGVREKGEDERNEKYADRDESNTAYVVLDFISPLIRRSVASAIVATLGYHPLRTAHRLLAEESIRHQIVMFRRSETTAFESIQDYRWLVQGFCHGLKSLPSDNELSKRHQLIKNDPTLYLPDDPKRAWTWLVQLLYLGLLEGRGDWQVSRRFCRDSLKVELIDRALDPLNFRETTSSTESMRWLDDHTLHELKRTLRLAKSFGHYLKSEFKTSLEMLNNTSVASHATPELTQWSSNFAEEKKALDVAVVWRDKDLKPDTWRIAIDALMNGLEPPHSAILWHKILEEDVASIQETLKNILNEKNYDESVIEVFQQNSNTVAFADHIASSLTQQNAAFVVDLLSRFAEAIAVDTDLNHGKWKLKEASDLESNQSNSRTTLPSDHENQKRIEDLRRIELENIHHGFVRSFSFHVLAEQLRRLLLSRNPDVNSLHISGHSARVYARTAIRLEKIVREHKMTAFNNQAGYFARRARRMLDLLAREMYRLPRERASMLILEATYARVMTSHTQRIPDLKAAGLSLVKAEKLVHATDPRSRVRMRFYMERHLNHRTLAHLVQTPNEKNMYKERANWDLAKLESLIEDHQKYESWIMISRVLRSSFESKKNSLSIKVS